MVPLLSRKPLQLRKIAKMVAKIRTPVLPPKLKLLISSHQTTQTTKRKIMEQLLSLRAIKQQPKKNKSNSNKVQWMTPTTGHQKYNYSVIKIRIRLFSQLMWSPIQNYKACYKKRSPIFKLRWLSSPALTLSQYQMKWVI